MATDDPAPLDKEELERNPKASGPWLAMIEEAETDLKDWQTKADNIDKEYANATQLAATGRDREFQMFWANIQVLGPSIYSRPPVPVVVPRFKDRRPVPRMASELLERSTVVGFELEDIDAIMRLVRDDLTVVARGCAWVRYDTKDGQRICIDHADRKDFLHGPARTWKEVPWVAKRSWLSKGKATDRFGREKAEKLPYEERRDNDNDHEFELKAGVWEIWHKEKNTVVWVGEGCDETLDEDKPHLKLEGFFPCPRPAYSTVQRRSLVPVPDMLFYKDQLEEINELTARIGALAEGLRVKGFYPSGAGEIGDAIEAAIKNQENNQILVPISNWALIGSGGVKDMIVWLPIDQVATTIVQLVELRKQLIADVYEITGLSDIMRGSTDANETLGAQELKSQYGSVRIRDRQNELARFSRDLVRISAEIMAENFTSKTMLEMSQLEIETDADIAKQIKAIEAQIQQIVAQVEQAKANPELQQQAQQNPDQAKQLLEQAQQQAMGLKAQIDELNEKPTVEKVMKLLRDQRVRPFVLDIETDSTIAPDENAQKQRATEFITAVGGFMNQALPLVQAVPQASKLMSETLKYVAGQFRAGRQLEGTIEEFADDMAKLAKQPKPPAPEQVKAEADAQAAQQTAKQEAERHQMDGQAKAADAKLKQDELAANQDREERRLAADMEAKDREESRKVEEQRLKLESATEARAQAEQQHRQKLELGALDIEKRRLELAALQTPEPEEAADPDKPPSMSISIKDVPPAAQSQMLAQAGISASADEIASHAQEQADQRAAEKAAAKPKVKEPA